VIVDYERAWLELKAHVVSKNSHGQRDLVSTMTHIELDCRLPEGERNFDDTAVPRSTPAVRPLREATSHG
jgi:hypothetical protein